METESVELDLTGEGSSHASKRRATQWLLKSTFMPLSKQQHDFHKEFTKFVIIAGLSLWKVSNI
eukprot:1141337-Pelagomonas_calceolata.AAC.2